MSETAAHLTSHSIITLGTKPGNKEEAKNINPSSQDKIISPAVIWAVNIIIMVGGINMKTQSWWRQSISVSSRKLCVGQTKDHASIPKHCIIFQQLAFSIYNQHWVGLTEAVAESESRYLDLTSSKIESWSWPYPIIPADHVTVEKTKKPI